MKLANIEKINFNKDGNYFQTADQGIDQLIDNLQNDPDIGYPIEGEMLNYICRGGRQGKMYLYSAGSGGGKTRFFMQQACYRSLPRLKDGKLIKGVISSIPPHISKDNKLAIEDLKVKPDFILIASSS